ncbi:hypothetical protein RUM43_008740 [Polyplax serrata]|uniref:Carboxylic ester hydrolase n=1 Tax=Polyplax serrata TaxID=468196 RepID=A0AAN8PVE2_POLSC
MRNLVAAVLIFGFVQVLHGYTVIPATYRGFDEKHLQVSTTSGFVKGFLGATCRNRKEFAGFRGIPYAEPPVGKLRFRDPVPVGSWEGVYNATFQRPGCMQGSFDNNGGTDDVFSEDCLYLNVYTPNVKYLEDDKTPLKAVMVFIHGGAFIMGSSSERETAPDFLVEQDVVLVTLNYRLGAFGFLSLQNENVPGNAGLKDQNLALKWVQKNIRAFGGDPNKVTIFGESAGSVSVHYHILSKASAGLFQGAIMESGSVLSSWAHASPSTSLQKAKKLAGNLKCKKTGKVNQIFECLQKIPADLLAKSQQQVLSLQDLTSMNVIAFEPTTEPNYPGAFMSDSPSDLLFSGNFTKVPTIIGSNSHEGLVLYPAFRNNSLTGLLLTLLGMDLSRLAPAQLNLRPFSVVASKVHQAISRFYFENKIINEHQMPKIFELIGDVNFIIPIQLATSLMAEHSSFPVYNYHFTYDGGYGIYKASTNMLDVPGVSHADELGYLFYTPGFHNNCAGGSNKPGPKDELMIDRMTRMWTNFAKTGNPTPDVEDIIPKKWLPFTPKSKNYFDIGENLVSSLDLKLDTLAFWNGILKAVLGDKNKKIGEFVEEEVEPPNTLTLSW